MDINRIIKQNTKEKKGTKTSPHHPHQPAVKKRNYSIPGKTTGSNPTQPPKH